MKPKVAMLSFSNFGTSSEMRTDRVEEAISIARELDPELIIDGPMQADTALVSEIQKEYPFMSFEGPANVLICPNLASANIAYKLLQRIAGAEMTGPISRDSLNQLMSYNGETVLEMSSIWRYLCRGCSEARLAEAMKTSSLAVSYTKISKLSLLDAR